MITSKQKIDELLTATTISSILASTTLPPMPPPSTAKPRLPKLTLPKFKRVVNDWLTFYPHNNTQIPKVDKFNYLNSMHEGTAFETVQGFSMTDKDP